MLMYCTGDVEGALMRVFDAEAAYNKRATGWIGGVFN
jgi:hypothetical protein